MSHKGLCSKTRRGIIIITGDFCAVLADISSIFALKNNKFVLIWLRFGFVLASRQLRAADPNEMYLILGVMKSTCRS